MLHKIPRIDNKAIFMNYWFAWYEKQTYNFLEKSVKIFEEIFHNGFEMQNREFFPSKQSELQISSKQRIKIESLANYFQTSDFKPFSG